MKQKETKCKALASGGTVETSPSREREVRPVGCIEGPVSIHLCRLWRASEMQLDTCWMYCVAKHHHPLLNLHYLIGIRGFGSPCSFEPPVTVCVREQIPYLLRKALIDKPSVMVFNLSFGLLHVVRPLRPPHPPLCLSAAVNIRLAASVGEKFFRRIKRSEIKMLPRHALRPVALKEIGPLAVLTGARRFPKNNKNTV